jgi:6-phosphogluconate dehydrogenase (decarboxylating)
MVPPGTPTEETIIDGGKSFYKDNAGNSDLLKKQGIDYLDAGTSVGVWGLSVGYRPRGDTRCWRASGSLQSRKNLNARSMID